MNQIGMGFWTVERPNPVEQLLLTRVGREPAEGMNGRIDHDLFTRHTQALGTIHQGAPRCSNSLIAHDNDMRIAPPEIMFQMMANPLPAIIMAPSVILLMAIDSSVVRE